MEKKFDASPIELRSDEIVHGVAGLIGMYTHRVSFIASFCILPTGNTPLVRINSLSDALGVEILGKAEVCLY